MGWKESFADGSLNGCFENHRPFDDNDQLTGQRGAGPRRMLDLFPAQRAETPDEVGNVGALLMDPDGAFITDGDFLVEGGVTVSSCFGILAAQWPPF